MGQYDYDYDYGEATGGASGIVTNGWFGNEMFKEEWFASNWWAPSTVYMVLKGKTLMEFAISEPSVKKESKIRALIDKIVYWSCYK